MDIYFWAAEDSKLVVDTLKSLLEPSQLDVAELEPEDESSEARHQDTLSPVVQNLENVAISDPGYQNGQTRDSQGHPQQPSMSGPSAPTQQKLTTPQPYQPAASVSPVSAVQSPQPKISKTAEQAPTFAPMPYNPAAPAAPEPIAHREDTPPPPDDGQGTGLAHAAASDHAPAYGRNQSQQWTGVPQAGHQPYQIGQPPVNHQVTNHGYGSPPPASHQSSFSGPPRQPSSAGTDGRQSSTAAHNYVPSPPPSQNQMYNQEPVQTPGAQFYSTNPNQQHKPLQHIQPQYPDYLGSSAQSPPPQGGYSQYSYNPAQQQPQQQQGGNNQYDVHSQVYRPTEAEHAHHRKPSKHNTNNAPQSKWETRAEKVEKKGGKFLKKLGI